MTTLFDDQLKYARYKWEFLRRNPEYINDYQKLIDILFKKYDDYCPPTGDRYLSWAFTEAVHLGRRHNERFRRYYNRKVAQANTSLATKALGNKLARICYYIMRDQVPFREELLCH